ncbi:MAG: histidine--tRNA ligase [Methanocella sp.]
MARFQSLKGFRDFYPEEMAARRDVMDKIFEVVRHYGFREVDTPSVESLELFRVKSGEEIVQQTFSFKDKAERDITLIPELTPTVARMVVERAKTLRLPIKWFSMPKMWRYEEPQSGRLREFYQLNVDIYGVKGPEADAEVLAVGIDLMLSLNLQGEFIFKISDRRLMQGILEGMGFTNPGPIFAAIDKRGKITGEEFKKMLYDAGMDDFQVGELEAILDTRGPMAEALPLLRQVAAKYVESPGAKEGLENLEKLSGLMALYNMVQFCEFDPSIIRGLAYYTATVFECFDTKGELRAIFGGGRYDKIVGLFGGEDMPAVGFGMGDAVLEILMRRAGVWPQESICTDYYILKTKPEFKETEMFIAQSLRERGFVVEFDLQGRNFSNQMKYANAIGSKTVLILGDREMAEGKVTVKDMTSGEQKTVEVLAFLNNKKP